MQEVFSDNLKKIRKLKHLSQEDMAQLLGLSTNGYCNYEKSKRVPPVDIFYKITQMWGINGHWLLTGKGAMFSKSENTLSMNINPNILNKFSKCGHRIIKIQEKNNLTNKEMAKIMGISESTYMKICAGNDTPNEKELNRLKENFDVDMDWLMYGDVDAHPNDINNQQNHTLQSLTPELYQKLLNILNNQ